MPKSEATWMYAFLHNLAGRHACADCSGGCDPEEQCRIETTMAEVTQWPAYMTGAGHAQVASIEQEPLLEE